ncbi:MAG: HAMP domain-containing protein, partial [Elainellaceae cyanobacterium]
MQRKITLAYGIAFLAAVLGSILGFTLSKQDEKAAFLSQKESMAQLVLINNFKGSVIELLVHQDELLNEIGDSPTLNANIQADFAHFIEDYQDFKQSWSRLSTVASVHQAIEESHITAQAAYATDQIVRLQAHDASISDYIQQIDGLTQDIDVSNVQQSHLPILRERLTYLNQNLFVSDLESFLDSIGLLETALQDDHAQATMLLRQATNLQIQVTIASILLSSGLGIVLMNRFSRILLNPLQRITRMTQDSIQAEVFDLKLPVYSQDEIGLLAQTLNLYV